MAGTLLAGDWKGPGAAGRLGGKEYPRSASPVRHGPPCHVPDPPEKRGRSPHSGRWWWGRRGRGEMDNTVEGMDNTSGDGCCCLLLSTMATTSSNEGRGPGGAAAVEARSQLFPSPLSRGDKGASRAWNMLTASEEILTYLSLSHW